MEHGERNRKERGLEDGVDEREEGERTREQRGSEG